MQLVLNPAYVPEIWLTYLEWMLPSVEDANCRNAHVFIFPVLCLQLKIQLLAQNKN